MNLVYLLLGSNEGDRVIWLQKAMTMIEATCGTIQKRSSIYETAAWGINEQPDFLNMVIAIHTVMSPPDLLAAILHIETILGRQREIKWGQRTLDIDILFYNNEVIDLPDLKIPHPFLQDRRFTLIPLAEIAPEMVHPVLHKLPSTLLLECTDTLEVHKYTK